MGFRAAAFAIVSRFSRSQFRSTAMGLRPYGRRKTDLVFGKLNDRPGPFGDARDLGTLRTDRGSGDEISTRCGARNCSVTTFRAWQGREGARWARSTD